MSGCGPLYAVGWCKINHNGVCTLETASFKEMDRIADRCGFIRVNNRYTMGKFGVPFRKLICGNCLYFNGGVHGFCTNEQVKPHKQCVTADGKQEYIDSKDYYSGAHACQLFIKKILNTSIIESEGMFDTLKSLIR